MSKSSEQKLKKEAKKQQAKRKEALKKNLFIVFLVVLIPIALYVFYQGLFGGATVYPPDVVSEADHTRGADDAPLTITMYGDFQCSSCALEANHLASSWAQISNKVRLVFRNYPLDTYAHSFEAAQYAEAAARQGMFWEMYNYLYADQATWSLVSDATIIFDGYAEDLGLDLNLLRNDVELPEIREKILADQRGGTRAGVRSTPTMYFNGEMVANPRSAGELVQMVNDFLAE